ncbi:unannotated protein [freshwater metagenome]|uniref:Unannotated protein n=1 Tax=freshwater metagenome TaxID=449393 RepID=A0A6J7KJ10_9ZZZZ
MRTHAQFRRRNSEIDVPLVAGGAPVLVPLERLFGRHEELEFHLLELTSAEHEVARSDLVAKRLADLGNTERWLLAAGLKHIREVDEHALRGLGAQIGHSRVGLHRAGVGLEHEVEVAGLGERVLATTAGAGGEILELVLTESLTTLTAVNERIGEVLQMSRCFPDGRRRENRGIKTHDVVAHLHHGTPPSILDVAQQLHADGAVVVGGPEPAVNLGRREHEATTLREVDHLLHERDIVGDRNIRHEQ